MQRILTYQFNPFNPFNPFHLPANLAVGKPAKAGQCSISPFRSIRMDNDKRFILEYKLSGSFIS